MNSFLYSRCNLVPRRVRHAQIEHRSAKVVMRPMERRVHEGTSLPVVVLGQLFGLGQGRLDLRRKEMGFSDGV